MKIQLSENAKSIPPSGTMQMKEIATNLEKTGRKIIHLGVGEPDFITPNPIIEYLIESSKQGKTKYTSARGIESLRKEIAIFLSKRDVNYDPKSQIIATPGSKHALYLGMQSLLNPGDEILILTPAWPTYMGIPLVIGAKPVEIPTTEEFRVNEENVKNGISGKTKSILINSPSNPTGVGFDKNELKFLSDIAIDNNLSVISDEVYSQITYNDFKQISIASLPGMMERTLLIDAFSKTFAMTGWRLGWAAGPNELIGTMVKLQQASTSCPVSMVQEAGAKALNNPEVHVFVKDMVKQYRERQAYLINALNEIPNVSCSSTDGAFYAFMKYSSINKPSNEIALELLKKVGVATIAGSEFGEAGEYHLRLSFASSMEELKEGVKLIGEFFSNYE
ncbi:MAG: pyridoxal phosphate-dependent aminotransferase [Candidatus Ranarchaeia archaeon]